MTDVVHDKTAKQYYFYFVTFNVFANDENRNDGIKEDDEQNK